jgi:hypothetical protein
MQSSGSESSASVLKSESNGATQIDCSSGAGDSISTLTLASSSLSRPVDATHSEGMGGSGEHHQSSREPQDPTLRPPASHS